jgi:uncharacterized protein (TIGR02118 family)
MKQNSRRSFLKETLIMAAAAPLGTLLTSEADAASEAIKIVHFFARKKGLTPKQFVNYWLHVHGAMTLKLPGRFSGYVLANAIHLPDDLQPDAIVGVSESFSPNASARAETLSSPQAKALVADQDNFVGKSLTFTTEEHVFVPRPHPTNGAIKRVLITVRRDGMTHDQFLQGWLENYGPAARGIAGLEGFILSDITAKGKDADPLPLGEIDGIQEAWWSGNEVPRSSPGFAKLLTEGDKLIDPTRSISLVVRDNLLIPPHYG